MIPLTLIAFDHFNISLYGFIAKSFTKIISEALFRKYLSNIDGYVFVFSNRIVYNEYYTPNL